MTESGKSGLPAQWSFARLEEIAEINPTLDKREIADDLEVSFVPMAAIEAETGTINVSEIRRFRDVKKGYTPFSEGDVLFAKITPCMENGKMAVAPKLRNSLGFGSTEFHVIRPCSGVRSEYLYYFVSSQRFRYDAEHNMTGAVGQRRVPATYLSQYRLPVAPSKEQDRIVSKIEELLTELDKGIQCLRTAREQLKVYRQAVLQRAFEGKLTEQWRENNKNKLESPDQLVARIQQEREARYEELLAKWKEAINDWETGSKPGRKLKRPLKPKRYSTPSSAELVALPSLPRGWRWRRLGEIGLVGTGVTPLKSNTQYYAGGNIPWVTSGALNESFVREPSAFVTEQAFNETNLRLYSPHTLVVALYGEGKTRGKCSELLIEATTNQAIAAIVQEGTSSELRAFLKWFLTKNYEAIRLGSSGGVQPNLNLGIIENTLVPVCAATEAKLVVETLEKELSVIDRIESDLIARIRESRLLRHSILKQAFSGQLVDQDPNDEPASALLDRIKVEKEERREWRATANKKVKKKAARKPQTRKDAA